MRDISEITVEEGVGLWNDVMPARHIPFDGAGFKFKAKEDLPERVVFAQGVERLGIYFGESHKIWADSDLIPIKLDTYMVLAYLTSIGIEVKPTLVERVSDDDSRIEPIGNGFYLRIVKNDEGVLISLGNKEFGSLVTDITMTFGYDDKEKIHANFKAVASTEEQLSSVFRTLFYPIIKDLHGNGK
jgi:hypothetical protein